ncbi:MAG: HEPN domain-containing protein [Treponema sp.]|nr:HEPN domain-containing protein [Treponema sp.]
MAKQTNSPDDWRVLAERDMSVAEHLARTMVPVPAEIIAFHCQQTAEKLLKGALEKLGEEPPYTHDLDELCGIAEKHRPSFASISSLCSVITHFSILPRYDRGLSLSLTDLNIVMQHTKTIKEFLQKEIPEMFTV